MLTSVSRTFLKKIILFTQTSYYTDLCIPGALQPMSEDLIRMLYKGGMSADHISVDSVICGLGLWDSLTQLPMEKYHYKTKMSFKWH